MDEILSHPETDKSDRTRLISHLDGVKKNIQKITPVQTSEKIPNTKELLSDIAYLHDIGKCTKNFQRYIRGEKYKHKLKQHSEIGALIGAHVLEKKYNSEYIALLTLIIIRNHHGYMKRNVDSELKDYIKTYSSAETVRERLQAQLKDMEHAEDTVNEILINCNSKLTYDDIITADVVTNQARYKRLRELVNKDTLYEDVLSLWSALITADKLDASGLSQNYFSSQSRRVDYDQLDEHIEELQSEQTQQNQTGAQSKEALIKINDLREEARQHAIKWAEDVDVDTNTIYNLSLPTGFGKTFSGLSAALKLSDRKEGNIIYALPFTAIIDQVDEDLQEIFKIDPTDKEYTIHHYLAETRTKIGDDNTDTSSRDEYMLAKSWNSHLTLTTFVQLFETLTTPKNTQALKIPALKNSVIILDEPQALSYDWWELIPRLSSFLMRKYNATVISMTATQPKLFSDSEYINNVREILPDKSQYYNHLKNKNRVEYRTTNRLDAYLEKGADAEPDTYEEISDKIKKDLQQDSINSICAICNTVKSTQALTKSVEKNIPDINFVNEYILSDPDIDPQESVLSDKTNLIHLSTRITPFDRRRLLKTLDYAIENNYNIGVISTQLIESGVDISFNKLYRDVSPIPSIIQAGGRCNRNNELDTGQVVITRLEPSQDDTDVTPAAMIYNNSLPLIDATRKTLTKDMVYPEGRFIQLTETFYNQLEEIGDCEYVDYVSDYNVEKLDTLSLINSYKTIDVSITNEKTKDDIFPTPHQFDNLSSGHKSHILTELEKYTVSIPLPRSEEEQKKIRNQLGFKFGEQYLLLRNSPTYSEKYGLDVTKQPEQFI